MLYALVAVSVLQTTLLIATGVFLWLKFRRLSATVGDFMLPPGEGQPSALAQTWEAACDMLSRSVAARMGAAAATASSAMVRTKAGVEADIMEDLARQNPVADALLSQFPTLRRSLRRNPALMDIGLQALTKALAGAQAKPAGEPQEPAALVADALNGTGRVNKRR